MSKSTSASRPHDCGVFRDRYSTLPVRSPYKPLSQRPNQSSRPATALPHRPSTPPDGEPRRPTFRFASHRIDHRTPRDGSQAGQTVLAMVESGQQGQAMFVNIGLRWDRPPAQSGGPFRVDNITRRVQSPLLGQQAGWGDRRVRARRPVDQRFRRRPCWPIVSIPEPSCRPSRVQPTSNSPRRSIFGNLARCLVAGGDIDKWASRLAAPGLSRNHTWRFCN